MSYAPLAQMILLILLSTPCRNEFLQIEWNFDRPSIFIHGIFKVKTQKLQAII